MQHADVNLLAILERVDPKLSGVDELRSVVLRLVHIWFSHNS
jgi:hypothetical protein